MQLAELIQCAPVTLEHMLDARERRAERQRSLCNRFGRPLISFTLNIPGAYKAYALAMNAFREGMAVMTDQLRRAGMPVLHREEILADTGSEGYLVVDGDAGKIKQLTVAVENGHKLGRVFDLDVLDASGTGLRGLDAGRQERSCLICGKPVWECARSRAHPAEELALRTAEMIKSYFDEEYADHIAALATKALLYEVTTTPKPGLVDQHNTGAHADMDLFTFIDSSVVLSPYFRDMVRQAQQYEGAAETMLQWLRFTGQVAEEKMFRATGGINTHKGLIFSMGLLCAAAGYLHRHGQTLDADALLETSGRIASETPKELSGRSGPTTHGEKVHQQYGLTGARGQAAAGFPAVRLHGYPAFKNALAKGCTRNCAGVTALLHLIAHVDDTNIVARKGADALRCIQERTVSFLHDDPDADSILNFAEKLDTDCIENQTSPGGSADLLALVYFLHFVETEPFLDQ